jgi:protein-tyrosine phosphatase
MKNKGIPIDIHAGHHHFDPDHVKLEGAPNFRDIGGYQTNGKVLLRKGIIFRSGELSKLTKSDIAKIAKMGIRTIIDLRTPEERTEKPDRLFSINSIDFIDIPIYPSINVPVGLKKYLFFLKKEVDLDMLSREFYHRAAFEHKTEIHQIMDTIANATRLPVVIHCAGGKDRTGIVTAFIQLFAGVSKETVMHDYMLTNDLLRPSIETFIRKYGWLKYFNLSLNNLRPLLEARHYYLEDVLNRLFQEYKTIDNYLTTGCEMRQETLTTLKSLLQTAQTQSERDS